MSEWELVWRFTWEGEGQPHADQFSLEWRRHPPTSGAPYRIGRDLDDMPTLGTVQLHQLDPAGSPT